MSGRETAYRRALAWYPASWRAANEEVVLGTLLDVAEAEGRDAPTLRERADLAVHGVRVRVERGLPRSIRDRASSLALGIGAGFAAVYLFYVELDRFADRSMLDEASYIFGADRPFGWGPFMSAGALVMLAWIAALVAGMLGARRIMLGALAGSVVAGVVTVAGGVAPWAVLRPSAMTLGVLALLALVVAIGDPGRTRRGVGWTAISAAATLAVIVALIIPVTGSAYPIIGRYFLLTTMNVYQVGAVFAILVLVALIARRGDWVIAVLLAAAPWMFPLFWEASADLGEGALVYALAIALLVGVPTAVWLDRRIRAADARLAGAAPPAP